MYEIAIVGLGPAGIIALASLPETKLANTILFEEHTHLVGNLALYGGIRANLTKQEILNAFFAIPRWRTKQPNCLAKYADTECPFLVDVCNQMREWILPDIHSTSFQTKRVTDLQEHPTCWKLRTSDQVFEAQKVLLCIGSNPKTMDLPKPTIPLPFCLQPSELQNRVQPSDHVVVIGTAHSGTLVLRNLKNLGCKDVVGIYRNTPFAYARDGNRRGIKQESANIADEIQNGAWGDFTPTLLPLNDFAKAYRAVERATYVLYAHGFEQPDMTYLDATGQRHPFRFQPETGQFNGLSNIWGFGIAFPSLIPETNVQDIGFQGFIRAIQNALPAIVDSNV